MVAGIPQIYLQIALKDLKNTQYISGYCYHHGQN
jgi:hypothetical protein